MPQVDVGKLRARLGMSQPEFARAFGLPLGTVRNFEQGRTKPDAPARALFAVIDRAPHVVMEALGVR